MDFQTVLCSSLAKIMPQGTPEKSPVRKFGILRGENFAFQVAFKSEDLSWASETGTIRVEVKSPLKKYIRVRSVQHK